MSAIERNIISVLKSLLPGEEVHELLNKARAEALQNVQAGIVKYFEEAIWEAIAEQDENVPQPAPAGESLFPTELLVYMYCLTVKDAGEWIRTSQFPAMENDNGFVEGVVCGDFCIVMSYVAAEVFREDVLEENMQNMSWLEEKVTLHQSVIESVMAKYPVLPMKFCTLFNSINKAREVVNEKYDQFMNILDSVKGCEEWGLKVFYQADTLQKYLATTDSRVKELNSKAGSGNSGAAYLIKKKLSEEISTEVESVAFNYAEQCHQEIKRFASKYTVNKLLGREVTNRPEDMVLNAAYLVSEEKVEALKEYVKEMEDRYKSCGFRFSFTGPWPPYNFTDTGGGAEKHV